MNTTVAHYRRALTDGGDRRRRPRRRLQQLWTAAALAVVLIGSAGAASTGVPAAAASTGVPAAAASKDDMAAAESKKTAGKSSTLDGYVRTGSDKGDKGYDVNDAYGDKDSDSYGFGTQVSFGSNLGDGGTGAYHQSSAYDDNGRSNPKYSAWHFEEKDGKPTKRYVYDSHNDGKRNAGQQGAEAEASEYDSVEAYDDPDDGGGSHAGFEVEEAEPEYGNLYDSADVYNDADTYY